MALYAILSESQSNIQLETCALDFLYFILLNGMDPGPYYKNEGRPLVRAFFFVSAHPFLLSAIAFCSYCKEDVSTSAGGTNKWRWQLNILAIKIKWNPLVLTLLLSLGCVFPFGKKVKNVLRNSWLCIYRILFLCLSIIRINVIAVQFLWYSYTHTLLKNIICMAFTYVRMYKEEFRSMKIFHD